MKNFEFFATFDFSGSRGNFDASQIFVHRLVAVGFADEQKVCADGQNLLADGLLRIDVVAQIDRIELAVARSVRREPAAGASAFAVLLILTLLRLDEFRSERQNPIPA